MEFSRVPTNGIVLHVAQAGPSSGPLVILLHGFPEFWYGWRHQIQSLARAGYRVWAPDQRGYNHSDKPDKIGAYTIDHLGEDIIGLIDAAGEKRAFLVGHDWGAAVAWYLAAKHPSRIEKMLAINVPHGAVMARHLRRSPSQMLKSWYIFFFQLPWFPELVSRFVNWYPAVQALRTSSRPGTFSASDLQRYREAWSQPRAFSSMINWYRAAARGGSPRLAYGRVRVPTTLLWGVQDRFLDTAMAQPSVDLCREGRLVLFEEATHWV